MSDLISREALKKHKVYSEERHEYVVPVYNIDNAPTVEPEITNDDLQAAMTESYHLGYELAETKFKRPQGDLADEVWKLYEKYHSHLATRVLEFGDELKDLLGKYQKDGAE